MGPAKSLSLITAASSFDRRGHITARVFCTMCSKLMSSSSRMGFSSVSP